MNIEKEIESLMVQAKNNRIAGFPELAEKQIQLANWLRELIKLRDKINLLNDVLRKDRAELYHDYYILQMKDKKEREKNPYAVGEIPFMRKVCVEYARIEKYLGLTNEEGKRVNE